MRLEEVLAFHPGADATADELQAGYDAARAKRSELLAAAAKADGVRAAGLLTADDKALAAAEQEAAQARRLVDRLDALLPQLGADLHAATGREAVAFVHRMAEAVPAVIGSLNKWNAEVWPVVAAHLSAGIRAEAEAHEAVNLYRRLVEQECRRQDVRDALAGRSLPEPPAVPAGVASLLHALMGNGNV